MTKTIKTLTTAAGLLTVGGATYLLFRPCTLLMFRLVDALGAMAALERFRESASAIGARLPEWVVYCLPNGLWSAAYVLTVDTLLKPSRGKLVVAGIMPAAGAFSEWLQAAGVLRGTFDALDIVAYLLPYVVYLVYPHTESKTV